MVHETARAYIDQELKKGFTIQEIQKDKKFFQDEIMKMKIEAEKKLNVRDMIFLDRGIPDTCAYYMLHGISFDLNLREVARRCSYKKVFLLDNLPYKSDYARVEDQQQQNKLYEFLEETYQGFGLEIVKVPVLPVKDRVCLVLNNL